MDEALNQISVVGNLKNSKRELDDQLFKISNEEQDLLNCEAEMQIQKEMKEWFKNDGLLILTNPTEEYQKTKEFEGYRKRLQQIGLDKKIRELIMQKKQIERSIVASKDQVESLSKSIAELEKKIGA